MAHLEFSKEITALLVIDPYNEFISAGPPSMRQPDRPDQDREAVVVINSRTHGNSETNY